jgi:hypothetical protein
MARDQMYQCEQKKPHLILDENKKPTGARKMEWALIEASEATLLKEMRCRHCHGAVRLHKKSKTNGPQDHVEHKTREDSERCQGGMHFIGPDHQMSLNPVI